MAAGITLGPTAPGRALVVRLFRGLLGWDGTAFSSGTPVDLPMTEGVGGMYTAALPAGVGPGDISFGVYEAGVLVGRGCVTPPAGPAPTPIDLTAGILSTAGGPAIVTLADGRSATAQRIPDLIAADQYLTRKAAVAAGRSPFAALRRARVAFGGAV